MAGDLTIRVVDEVAYVRVEYDGVLYEIPFDWEDVREATLDDIEDLAYDEAADAAGKAEDEAQA